MLQGYVIAPILYARVSPKLTATRRGEPYYMGMTINIRHVEKGWGDTGNGWVQMIWVQISDEFHVPPIPPQYEPLNLVYAIRADMQTDCWGTYANILLRPAPKQVKDSPVPLLPGEVTRIKTLNGFDLDKWKWIAATDTKRIYLEVDGVVKITSISGWYSGTVKNKFNVLSRYGAWVQVETLKAGSGWHNNPIPDHLLHTVYGLSTGGKLINPPCGTVVLPVITRTGFGWIHNWQLE